MRLRPSHWSRRSRHFGASVWLSRCSAQGRDPSSCRIPVRRLRGAATTLLEGLTALPEGPSEGGEFVIDEVLDAGRMSPIPVNEQPAHSCAAGALDIMRGTVAHEQAH